MPLLKTKTISINILKKFNEKINNFQIIYDLASQAFFKYKKEFSIIKKVNENVIYFFSLL